MEDLNALAASLVDFFQSSPRPWNDRNMLQERVRAVLARPDADPVSRRPLACAIAERVQGTALLLVLLAELQIFDEFDSATMTYRLPVDMLAAWWRRALPERRRQVVRSLNGDRPWHAVAIALADAEAEVADVEELCAASMRLREDTGRRNIAQGIGTWTARATGRASAMLGRWMAREISLPLEVVRNLVLVAMGGAELADAERMAIILRLLGSSSFDARVIGMKLECFAWPASTPAARRHEALLDRVRIAPRLGLEALEALNESVWSFPNEALRSMNVAAELLRDDAGAAADARIAIAVATGVARSPSARSPVDTAGYGPLARRIVPHPLGGGDLDGALSCLFERVPDEADRVLRELLELRTRELLGSAVGFRECFPLVAHTMGEARQHWLTTLAQDASPRLRAVAWSLLAREEPSPTVALLADIEDAHAIRAAHDLADHPSLGEQAPFLLGLLVASRPALVDALVPVALPVLLEYAGRAEQAIALWREPPKRRALRDAADGLARRLAERDAALTSIRNIPEVMTLTAAREDWARADDQLMAEMFAQARARSQFAALVANVTIVRGASSSFIGGAPTTFSDVRFSAESSRLDFIDPVDAMNRANAAMTRLFPGEDQ